MKLTRIRVLPLDFLAFLWYNRRVARFSLSFFKEVVNIGANWISGVAELRFNRATQQYESNIQDYRVGVETRRIIERKVDFLNRVLDDVTMAYAQQFFLAIFRGLAGATIAFIIEYDIMGNLLPKLMPLVSSSAIILFWLGYYFFKEWRFNCYLRKTILHTKRELVNLLLLERKRRSAEAAKQAIINRQAVARQKSQSGA